MKLFIITAGGFIGPVGFISNGFLMDFIVLPIRSVAVGSPVHFPFSQAHLT
jgi:hypothetical protein